MKIKSSKCPYCGYDLGLLETLEIKDNQTYTCIRCSKVSEVELDEKIKLIVFIFVAISVATMVIFSLILRSYFGGAMLIILVWSAFYVLIPLFLELKMYHTKRKK